MSIEDLSAEVSRPAGPDAGTPALVAEHVGVFRWSKRLKQRIQILEDFNVTIGAGEHWAVLGPNGAGKTTFLHLAAADSHPSTGTVDVLGERLGRTRVGVLRERIGLVDSRTAAMVRPRMPALETVLSGAFSSIALQRDRMDESHLDRARLLLDTVGLSYLSTRQFGECSQGERQRILLARAVMPDPELLLLDEPASGLDLPSREQLVSALDTMAGANPGLTSITVTHHLEEIPPSTTHAMLIKDRRILAEGPVTGVLTGALVSECFDVPVAVGRLNDRWSATLRSGG